MLPVIDHSDKHEVVCALIIEQTMEPVKPNIIHIENSPGLHFARFEACLQDFDVFNRNNRKYLYKPMVESWNATHIKELIRKGDMFGENGHPITKDPTRVVTIDLKCCCHRIVGIEFKGKALYGTIETLNDDMWGKQFMQHLVQGCSAAFSLRALAPLTKIDAVRCEVRSKVHVVTEDRVILPSHCNAYQDENKPIDIIKGMTAAEAMTYLNDSTNPHVIEQSNYVLSHFGNTSIENVNKEIPLTESTQMRDLTNYLLEGSHNVKEIIDHFEVNYTDARILPDNKTMYLTENADEYGTKRTFAISLEGYVRNEVSEMLTSW